jgi:hypothetical protein
LAARRPNGQQADATHAQSHERGVACFLGHPARTARGDQYANPPGGYSLAEFRELHGYSERTLNDLRKRGLAPKETLLPNSKYARITEADYLAWLEVISQPDNQVEEYLRRRKFHEAAGRTSLKSPGHPANVWPKLKRANNKQRRAAG